MAMLRVYKAVRPMAGFLNDEAPTSSAHTAELYATVRDDGRIADDFRFNLGGSEFIEATFKLSAIFSDPELADWTVKIHTNPAEIKLRRNLFSGVWGTSQHWWHPGMPGFLTKTGTAYQRQSSLGECKKQKKDQKWRP